MARSSTGVYRPRRYATDIGAVRWRTCVPVGYYPSGAVKKKTVTGRTYRECASRLTDLLEEIRDNGAPVDHSVTLGIYARRWLEAKSLEVSPKSARMYRSMIENHFGQQAATPLSSFTPSMIQRMLAEARAYDKKGRDIGPAGESLQRQLRSTLHSVFEAARKDGLITRNPAEKIGLPRDRRSSVARRDESERTAFTVEQMSLMLEISADPKRMDPMTGARMWFRMLTGMRQGEILGARVRDLSLWMESTTVTREEDVPTEVTFVDDQGVERTGTIMARRPVAHEERVPVGMYEVNWKLEDLQRDHGCGERRDGRWPCGKNRGAYCPQALWRVPDGFDMIGLEGRWALTRPKSHTGRRVPMIPVLAQVLMAHLERLERADNPSGLLFPATNGGPIDPHDDIRDFRDLLGMAGVPNPDGRYGHETRHSTVSLLAAQGVDTEMIERIVGHSSAAMVAHYRHTDDAEMLRAMETLDSALDLRSLAPGQG